MLDFLFNFVIYIKKHTVMKKITLLLATLISFGTLYSQNITLTGKTVDVTSKEPIIAAKIILQNPDSTPVKCAVCNEKGIFTLADIARGDYRLAISSVGMKTQYVELKGLSSSLNLGEIALEEAVKELQSVEVQARSVINQSDRKLYFVSDDLRKKASNGVTLIQQLNLPKLMFDPVANAIKSVDRKSVQLRINDVPAEITDITAIQPKDIVRVEYIDNPGLRYGTDVGYVLNYIVKKRQSGGSAGFDTGNSVNRIFGQNSANVKLHSNKSEFSMNYYIKYLSLSGLKRTNVETFRFENGTERVREEIGIPANAKDNNQRGTLNYNYTDADKRVFNAKLQYYSNAPSDMNFISQSFWRDAPHVLIDMKDQNKSSSYAPSLDLYYLEKLKNDQTLIFDLYYSKRLSNVGRTYTENLNNVSLTDITSDVDGNRDTYIGEMMYEKKFKAGKLTAGIKHQQSYTTNTYSGDNSVKTNMVEANSYLYSEFSGKLKKWNYTLGLGLNRANIIQQNGEKKQLTDFFFQPRVKLRYNINDASYVGLQSRLYNQTPSLSQLSHVSQAIDLLQIQRGNPNLKAWISTYSEINYSYSSKIIDLNAEAGYLSRSKPVMEETLRENDKFIRTFDNQRYWGRAHSEISLGIRPWKDYIIIKLTGGYYNFLSEGNTYRHIYNDFSHSEQITLNYKGMALTFQNYKNAHWLMGETAEANESLHLVDFTYNNEKFSVGCMMFSPFAKTYKRDTEQLSAYAPRRHEWYSNEIQGLFMLKFSYNLRWGEAHKASAKRINNADNDSGILQGGK